jgi:RNA polymerase sigma-70 factor (TIGR02960 family)
MGQQRGRERRWEDRVVRTDLIARAKTGDERAFEQLVEPHRRELHVHCYRVLGSVQDAEDVLQEVLLAAWHGLSGFEERSSLRSWLYRIATNRCLNALRSADRRPLMEGPLFELEIPEPTRFGEVFWLEPYPDRLLEEGPESEYETREALSLAFITALQLLPPRQRVVLILRDVLGFRAREVAEMLESSEESVTSALKRARETLRSELRASDEQMPPSPDSAEEREVLAKLVRAFEARDVDALVALLSTDAWVRMPPVPLEYQGRDSASRFFGVVFRPGRQYRLVPTTRANSGQPTFGVYVGDAASGVLHAMGLLVITLARHEVSAITRFDNSVLARFGLPRTLPE